MSLVICDIILHVTLFVNHPESFVYSDLLGHCKDYYQHKPSKLFHCIVQVIYVVLAIISKTLQDHMLCLLTKQVHYACLVVLFYNSSNDFLFDRENRRTVSEHLWCSYVTFTLRYCKCIVLHG